MNQSLYEVLGVPRDATQETIKRRYRRLARKYHPDANPGDPTAVDKYRAVVEAWEVLGDPDKRAAYDRDGTIPTAARNNYATEIVQVVSAVLLDILHMHATGGNSTADSVDVVDELKRRIEGFVGNIKDQISNLKNGEKLLADAVGRFNVATGEDNYLRDIVSDRLRGVRQNLAAAQIELEKLARVRKYLAKCSYDFLTGKPCRDSTTMLEAQRTMRLLGFTIG